MQMLLSTINAVVWCGSLRAPDWNSLVCLSFCHAQPDTHIFVFLLNSSFRFIVCIEVWYVLNPCVCLCIIHHWFLRVCPGVHQAFWVSTATIRTLVNLATAWMEGTALCPCQLVYLYLAVPLAPALLASPDSTAKLPRTPRVTPTTPVPTGVSVPCCPSTSTSASAPEDGQVRYYLIILKEFATRGVMMITRTQHVTRSVINIYRYASVIAYCFPLVSKQ